MLLPSAETPSPVAPFTGALLYPLAEILELARGIVHNLERHHKNLLRSAQDRGDYEEEAVQLNNLVDIGLVLGAVDPMRCVCSPLFIFFSRWEPEIGSY